MQRTLDLWFLLAAVFALFVAILVWRAALQIRMMRRRLEEVSRNFIPVQGFEVEADSEVETDWVPRR